MTGRALTPEELRAWQKEYALGVYIEARACNLAAGRHAQRGSMFPLPSLKALHEDFLDEIYHEKVERIDQQPEKATGLDNIKQYLDIGKCIVQFVKNSTRVHAFYQAQHPKRQLVKPVTTRFGTYYYMLRNTGFKDWLRSQPATTTDTTNQAMTAVEDFNFWAGVEKVMQLMEPVVMAIKFFDCSASTIGFVWQAWEDRNRQEATAAFNRVQHRFYPNVEDAHKLNQEYFAYVDGTSPFSIADSCDAQELLEKGKDGDSPWHVWASAVSFSCDSGAMLWRLHPEQAEKLIHIYQNHRIWDRKESETSMWIGGEFDIPKENDSPVVGGNGTGHTTTGFRSYAEVDADNSMSKDEDDDFDRDSDLRLIVCKYYA
ncbi:hypothetical protein SELMODRAFT_427904 [Selaginella moellendorffii]|uniref:Uncharacterized protein n=1 Tax=Selaginella moellendorffii TaxID=88036 RepID=D8T129_SELML|nr:hypothetical protein SELMODRAFT_427904 [Selaginella moellendorffii]